MDYDLSSKDGITWVRFDNIAVPHGVSTRAGGVSSGPYASLNLGRMSGDDLDKVAENRRLFGDALGFTIHQTLQMVHGREVAVLTQPEQAHQSHAGDACVSAHPEISMSLTTADCVPILFYDPESGAVGLAHAGWKGTLAGVAQATVEAMQTSFSARPEQLQVAIGPAILRCCFEVDEEVASQFRKRFPDHDVAFPRDPEWGKWEVDLHKANRQGLLEAGVAPGNIRVCPLCTACREDLFYSYRRDKGVTGRLLTAISPKR